MAVSSDNKQVKKKQRNAKKKPIKELNIKEEIVNDEIKESVQEKIILENENVNNFRKNKKTIIFVALCLLLLLGIYLLFPKIKLKGNNEITITYNQLYTDPGYTAKVLFKDITKNIKTKSNLNNTKTGKYKIKYYLEYGLFDIAKTRIINVIDNIRPEIMVDDIINVCPNEEVHEIEFKANDEYDGDLTNYVIQNRFEDKIILSVSDKSNNQTVKEIVIDREDKTAPEIKLNGNETIYLSAGAMYTEPGYTANDNCDGVLTDKVEVSSNVSTSPGTYKVTYSVSDSFDNKIEITRTVIVRNYNLYNSGSINNGTIYLTFDDGPSEGTTNVILDVLKEQGVKATFFVTCNGPDYLIKRIYDEGHTVALHTASHDYGYIYSSVDNYFNDLDRVGNRVKNITGVDSKIIRFPGGSSNTVSRRYQYGIMTTLTAEVLNRGYRYFDWNVDAMDASSARSSSDVYNNVINHLSMNRANVVLMHDIKAITRDALRNIIKTAQSQGYTFSKIDMDTYMVRHGVNN